MQLLQYHITHVHQHMEIDRIPNTRCTHDLQKGPQSSRSRGDLEPGRPRARRRQVQDQGTDGLGRRARGARRSQGHGTRAVTVRGPLNHSTAAGGRAGNNLFPSRGCARGPAGRPVDGSADPRAPALIRVLAGYGWTAQRHGARRPRSIISRLLVAGCGCRGS